MSKTNFVGVNTNDLFQVKVPDITPTYKPVSHKEVIDITRNEIEKAGLIILSEKYNMAAGGNKAFGYCEIGSDDSEMNIRIIWHNSYDKSMPVRWAIGSHVMVCENGMVFGDLGSFKRRHRGTVLEEYEEQCRINVGNAYEMFENLKKKRDQMKEIEITKHNCAEIVGCMFLEEDVITATQIGIIKKELENPSYGNYGAPGSVWELYNHTTVALKEEHPALFINRHIAVSKFFEKEFQLV